MWGFLAYVCVCVYVCVSIYIYIYRQTHTNIYLYMYMYVCINDIRSMENLMYSYHITHNNKFGEKWVLLNKICNILVLFLLRKVEGNKKGSIKSD
jgi:hypothetical protein